MGQFGTINFAKESKGTITDGLVKCAACKPSQMLTRLILVPTVCFVLVYVLCAHCELSIIDLIPHLAAHLSKRYKERCYFYSYFTDE